MPQSTPTMCPPELVRCEAVPAQGETERSPQPPAMARRLRIELLEARVAPIVIWGDSLNGLP